MKYQPLEHQKLEYRYYNMPVRTHAFAFIGDIWGHTSSPATFHFHNCLEIGLCHTGNGYGQIEEKFFQYHAGDLCVIPAGTIHGFSSSPGTTSHWEWIMLDPKGMFQDSPLFSPLSTDSRFFTDQPNSSNIFPKTKEDRSLHEKAALLFGLFHLPQICPQTVQGLAAAFLCHYLEKIPPIPESLSKKRKETVTVMPALVYIQEHFREKLSIRLLADRCGLSEEQFRRNFRSLTHMSPLDYLNHYRIQEACQLLQDEKQSIRSIAENTGFPTASTFNRQFIAIVGISPLKWQKNARQKQDVTKIISLDSGKANGILPS